MLEKTKFDYSSPGKDFEKQEKTIKYQRDKQIGAINKHGVHLARINALIKKYDYDSQKDIPLFLKQKTIFNELITENMIKYYN